MCHYCTNSTPIMSLGCASHWKRYAPLSPMVKLMVSFLPPAINSPAGSLPVESFAPITCQLCRAAPLLLNVTVTDCPDDTVIWSTSNLLSVAFTVGLLVTGPGVGVGVT